MKKINKKWISVIVAAITAVAVAIVIITLTTKERDSTVTGDSSNSSSSSINHGDIDNEDDTSSSFITGDIDNDSSSSSVGSADADVPSLAEAIKTQDKLNTDLPDGAMVGGDTTVSDNVIGENDTAVITNSDIIALVDDKMISSDILPLPKGKKKDVKVVQIFNIPYANINEKKLENLDMGLSVKDHTYYSVSIVKSKGTKTAPSQEYIEIKTYR